MASSPAWPLPCWVTMWQSQPHEMRESRELTGLQGGADEWVRPPARGHRVLAERLWGLPAWEAELRSGKSTQAEPACSVRSVQTKRRNASSSSSKKICRGPSLTSRLVNSGLYGSRLTWRIAKDLPITYPPGFCSRKSHVFGGKYIWLQILLSLLLSDSHKYCLSRPKFPHL